MKVPQNSVTYWGDDLENIIQATDITMHIVLREGDDVILLNHVMPGKSFLIYLD